MIGWIQAIDRSAGGTENEDYCPAAVQHLERCLPKLHTLTGLLSRPIHYAKDATEAERAFDYIHWPRHFTNTPVECWHKNVKQDILCGNLKQTPTNFIRLLEEGIEVRFHAVYDKLVRNNPNLKQKSSSRRSGSLRRTSTGLNEMSATDKNNGNDPEWTEVGTEWTKRRNEEQKVIVAQQLFGETKPPPPARSKMAREHAVEVLQRDSDEDEANWKQNKNSTEDSGDESGEPAVLAKKSAAKEGNCEQNKNSSEDSSDESGEPSVLAKNSAANQQSVPAAGRNGKWKVPMWQGKQ